VRRAARASAARDRAAYEAAALRLQLWARRRRMAAAEGGGAEHGLSRTLLLRARRFRADEVAAAERAALRVQCAWRRRHGLLGRHLARRAAWHAQQQLAAWLGRAAEAEEEAARMDASSSRSRSWRMDASSRRRRQPGSGPWLR
jgi:hypothetical protein